MLHDLLEIVILEVALPQKVRREGDIDRIEQRFALGLLRRHWAFSFVFKDL
jgi:hypothetical protein